MVRSLGSCLLLTLLVLGPASSAPLQLLMSGDDVAAPPPEIEVLSTGDDGMDLRFSLSSLLVEDTQAGGLAFQSVRIPGGGTRGAEGAPEIATFTRLVAIPARAGVRVVGVVEEEEDLEGVRLVPTQGYAEKGFRYDASAYAVDAFDDAPAVTAGEPAILRELRVVPITFRPIRYNPAEGRLRVARSIRVTVSYEGGDPRNMKTRAPRALPPSFERLYRSLVVNYGELEQAQAGSAPGSWIVICVNDSGVISRLQPLVEWRARKGFPAVLATTAETGTSASSIKSWIQNAYDTWDSPPEYIVLAGDATGSFPVATWFENLSGFNGEGDLPYTLLEGGDVLPDAHVGRLSFGNMTELEVIVKKIIGYESAPELQDPGWFGRACLVADPYDSGYSTIQVQQWIKDRLRDIGYTQIDTIYGEPFVSRMTASLNQGDTILSYRGIQGMSGWQNSNTYAMTNGWKMPFVVTITCDTGSFANGTSRSEGFLRANAGADSPRGGIGAIGTATSGTHTRYNNCVHYGIFRGLLFEDAYALGAALTRGRLEMYLNYYATQPDQAQIWMHWNNLMGDPALECWTAFPAPLTVQHPASIPLGANAVTVTVLEEGGTPSSGAQVCLLKSGETQAVGITNELGQAELLVSTPTTGEMLVTVSKHDRHPYQAAIPVAPQNVFVGYASSAIDDDATGESSGNADGVANPLEAIELPVQLRNFGPQTASNVTATLDTDDPYVTVTDGQETYGNIAGGAILGSADDFGFTLAGSCPHGHVARLGLDVYADQGHWRSLIEIPVVSADLSVTGTTLYNAGANGDWDPGETIELSLALANGGGATAGNVTGSLTSLSNFLTIVDGQGSFGTIGVGDQGENVADRFSISAAPDTYQGYLGTLRCDLTYSNGVTESELVTVRVGTRESDDPLGPDRYGYYAFDDTDAAYPDAPAYAWVEIDPNHGGQGTQVPLTDNGTYQDDSEVVDLPFEFQYYGQKFTRATICSNGWIAMGSTWLTDYRNWTIPAAGGPDGMISVFWDDLRQTATGKVYQYHDAANHRWIVEWSRMVNEPGSTETVEAIFHDPAFVQTPTGDGVILLQYNQVANTDSGDSYATVGIESPDGLDGLLYTFHNQYPPGAATLAAGRAIRLVPVLDLPSGTLSGNVRNASYGEAPIPGVEVRILELGRNFVTSADGHYAGTVQAGSYTIVARHASFDPDTAYAVVIAEQQQTDLDFHLIDTVAPILVTQTHGSTDDVVGPYPIPVTITEYSGLPEKELRYRVLGGAFTSTELQALGGNSYAAQIPGQPYITRVEYYVRARDSQGLERTDPAGAPGELYSFFVAPLVELFADDMEAQRGWTVGAPDDNAVAGIWERVNPAGTFDGPIMVQPEDDHTESPGVNCFVTDGRGGAEGDYDVDGGKTTLTSPVIDLTSYGDVTLVYHRWYTNDTGNYAPEDLFLAQISDDGGETWVTLETLEASERIWKRMEFSVEDYVEITGAVRLRFVASDVGFPSVVEAAIDDVTFILRGVTDAPDAGRPLEGFALSTARPNPSNASAAIRFSLERAGLARLAVYDVQGRLVRRLLEGARAAGSQVAVWDGRDERGARVESGVYLVRLEGDGGRRVRKIVRIE